MTKKEYILKVLDRVIPYWEWAISIKEKILSWIATDEYIEDMYQKCVKSVDITLKQQDMEKMKSLSSYLKNLQQEEFISHQADEEDIKNLENLLNTI